VGALFQLHHFQNLSRTMKRKPGKPKSLHSPLSLFGFIPNFANGSRSTAAGTSLAIATASTGAQVTIHANDKYGNERGDGDDKFSARNFPSLQRQQKSAWMVEDSKHARSRLDRPSICK
jgi:hypothetical protein